MADRESKRSAFESFVPDDITITIPVENLHEVMALVEKDEELPGKRVAVEEMPDDSNESVKRFSHIDRRGIDGNFCIDVEVQHDAISRTILAMNSGEALLSLSTTPFGSTRSMELFSII